MDDLSPNETSLLISRSGIPYHADDNRQPYQKRLAVYFVLASTFLECIAFYSLVINLFAILQEPDGFHWDSGNTITVSFIFFGVSYLSTIVFAALSDGKLGRAITIVIGFCLFLIGYTFVLLVINNGTRVAMCGVTQVPKSNSTNTIPENYCFGGILGILIFTAIGVGGTFANMAVFGAEQVQESNKSSRYFDKYVLVMNLGAVCAVLFVSYLQDFNDDPNRHLYGYLFAISSLFTALVIFVAGKRCYIYIPPHDTIITKCFPVLINAGQTWRKSREERPVMVKLRGKESSTNFMIESTDEYDQDFRRIRRQRMPSFLEYARVANGGKYIDRIVNDVKTLRRALLVFILLIPCWLIVHQAETTFVAQGHHMDIPFIITNSTTHMPVIWMTLGDSTGTIVSIIFLRIFIYKYLDKQNESISIYYKFLIGMIIASITMIIAGTVEIFRQRGCCSDCENSELSIFVQFPQYFCMGIMDAFVTIASLEFAYLSAPRSAQSLIMSLRFCSLGFSSFLNNAYVRIFTVKQFGFMFDCSRKHYTLYVYFYVLGVIPLFTILLLYLCNRKFKILRLNPYSTDKRQFL